MPERPGKRTLAFFAALALALGIALGIAVGTDEEPRTSPRLATGTTTPTTPTATRPERRPSRPRRRRSRRQVRAVQATVERLVRAAERGDAAAFCRLLGRPARAQDPMALAACGGPAGIDPFALPTSDELSIEEARVSGQRASARLADGRAFMLRRRGRLWRVVALRPAP